MSEPPPGAAPTEYGSPPPAETLPPVPDDADDTRGAHFKALIGHPTVLIAAGIVALVAFVAAALAGSPLLGLAAVAAIVLLAVIIVFAVANSRAREDFFRAYAEGRGLERVGTRTDLPPLTPLLQKGDRRYAEQRFNGTLPGGLDGSLCLYTYEEEYTDSEGDRQTTYVRFTLALADLPETAPFMRELFCQRRVGFRFMDSTEDIFRRRQRVEHESEEVDKRFEVFIGEGDDLNRARQVLSPQFLVWLADHSPEAFAFELSAGSLVCNVKGHKTSAAELDLFCEAAAAVAARLHGEATE